MRLKNNKLVLTVSYGNYTEGNGGTDKVLLAHQEMFNQAGISMFHLYPIRRVYDKVPEINLWGLLVDGVYKGMYVTEQILRLLKRNCSSRITFKAILIHHFNGIQIEEIHKLLSNIDAHIFFYLHDYMSICPDAGLVYNKERFCNNVTMDKVKCDGCRYYTAESQRRAEKIEALMNRFKDRITVIAPSPTAADVWLRHYAQFKKQVKVIYHQKLFGEYLGNKQIVPKDKNLRIAFVGYQADIKGWPWWIKAVEAARKAGCNYEFYQFGTVKNHYDYIQEVKIDFKDNLSAMTKALRQHKIDCAVIWSIWPETYSYTYYEAFSSNCYIITNDLSGNIAFQVQKNGNGIVLNGEERLVPFLQNEQLLRQKINEYKTSAIKGPNVLRENDNIVGVINDTFGSVESIDRITADKKKKVSYYNRYKSHYENLEKRRIFLSRHYHNVIDRIKNK